MDLKQSNRSALRAHGGAGWSPKAKTGALRKPRSVTSLLAIAGCLVRDIVPGAVRHGAHPVTRFCLAGGEQLPRSAQCGPGSPRCVARVDRRHACRLGGYNTNDHFACSRSRCQSGGDVDGITECYEVVDGGAKPGHANECLAGVDGRSYWDGHPRRAAGSCPLGQVDCGRYCCCRVSRPGDSAEEKSDNLIAHDFVNDAVMVNDRIGCHSIEAGEECVEVGGAHAFSHGSRAADIREQQGDRDLHARQLAFAKVGYASCTESWIAGGSPEPRVPEDQATQPGERSCAQLAAGRGRDSSEGPSLSG